MKCYNCGNEIDEEKVYSNRGMIMKCCSVSCLAYSLLDIRVASLKETKRIMGEE